MKVKSFSCVQLFATPWTVTYQAPLSMGFSRQEHLSGLPCPPPGDLPDPGIQPMSPALQVDSLPTEPPGKPHDTKSGVKNIYPFYFGQMASIFLLQLLKSYLATILSYMLWCTGCPTLCDPMDCSLPGAFVHGDSPGKNAGVGSHALLQGIFPTQGLIPGLSHCRWILYHLSHQGSPRIL